METKKNEETSEQIPIKGLTREIICDLLEIFNKNKVPESHSKCFAGSGVRVDASSLKKIVSSFGISFSDDEVERAIISFSRGDALTFNDFIKFYLWYISVYQKIISKASAALNSFSINNWKEGLQKIIDENMKKNKNIGISGFLLYDLEKFHEEIEKNYKSPSDIAQFMIKSFNQLPRPIEFSRKDNISPYLTFDITLWNIFGLIPYEYIGIENDLPSLDVFIQLELCNQTYKSAVFPARYSPSISQTFSFDYNSPSKMSFLDASWWIQNTKLKISVYAVHYLDNFVAYHLLGTANQPLVPLLVDQHGRSTCAINLQALTPSYPIPILISISNKVKENDETDKKKVNIKTKPENMTKTVNPLIYHSAPIEQLIFERFIRQIRDNLLKSSSNLISEKSFIRYCNFFKEITTRFPAREYQLLGFDEMNVAHFINRFINTFKFDKNRKYTNDDFIYIVSLKGSTVFDRPEPEVMQIRSLITSKTCKLDPNILERAILLCFLLNSNGSHAYVCIGDHQFQRYVWVMSKKTFPRNKKSLDFMMFDCGNKAYSVSSFINHKFEFPTPDATDRIDGQEQIIFSHGINPLLLGISSISSRAEEDEYLQNKEDDTWNPHSEMRHYSVTGIWPDRVPCGLKVATVFNSLQIYCNIQDCDDIDMVKWDFDNREHWAPLYNNAQKDFVPIYPDRFLKRMLIKPKLSFTDEELNKMKKLLWNKKFNMFKKNAFLSFDKFTSDWFQFHIDFEEVFALQKIYKDQDFLNNFYQSHLTSLLETQLLLNLTPIQRQILNAYLICKDKVYDESIKMKRFKILLRSQKNEDRKKINKLIRDINLSILKLNSNGHCKFIEMESIIRFFMIFDYLKDSYFKFNSWFDYSNINSKGINFYQFLLDRKLLDESNGDIKFCEQYVTSFQLDYLHLINYHKYFRTLCQPIYDKFGSESESVMDKMGELSYILVNNLKEEEFQIVSKKMKKIDPDYDECIKENAKKEAMKKYISMKKNKNQYFELEIFLQYIESLTTQDNDTIDQINHNINNNNNNNNNQDNNDTEPVNVFKIYLTVLKDLNSKCRDIQDYIYNQCLKLSTNQIIFRNYEDKENFLKNSSSIAFDDSIYIPDSIINKELLSIIREDNENIYPYYSIQEFFKWRFSDWEQIESDGDDFESQILNNLVMNEKLEILSLIEMVLEILYKFIYNPWFAFVEIDRKYQVNTFMESIFDNMKNRMRNQTIRNIIHDYQKIFHNDPFTCSIYENMISESFSGIDKLVEYQIKYKISLSVKKALIVIRKREKYALPHPNDWCVRCSTSLIYSITETFIKLKKTSDFDLLEFIDDSIINTFENEVSSSLDFAKYQFGHSLLIKLDYLINISDCKSEDENEITAKINDIFYYLISPNERIEFEIFKQNVAVFKAFQNIISDVKKIPFDRVSLSYIYEQIQQKVPEIDEAIESFNDCLLEKFCSFYKNFIDNKKLQENKKLIKRRIKSFRLTEQLIQNCIANGSQSSSYLIPKKIIVHPPTLVDFYPNSMSNLFMSTRLIIDHIRNKPFYFLFLNKTIKKNLQQIQQNQPVQNLQLQQPQQQIQQSQQQQQQQQSSNQNQEKKEIKQYNNSTKESMLNLRSQLMIQKENTTKRYEQQQVFKTELDRFSIELDEQIAEFSSLVDRYKKEKKSTSEFTKVNFHENVKKLRTDFDKAGMKEKIIQIITNQDILRNDKDDLEKKLKKVELINAAISNLEGKQIRSSTISGKSSIHIYSAKSDDDSFSDSDESSNKTFGKAIMSIKIANLSKLNKNNYESRATKPMQKASSLMQINAKKSRNIRVKRELKITDFKFSIVDKRKKEMLRLRWESRQKVKNLLKNIHLVDEMSVPYVSFESKREKFIDFIDLIKTEPGIDFNENQEKELNNLLNLDVAMSTSSSLLIFHKKWSEERLIKQIQKKLISFENDIKVRGRYDIKELHNIVNKSIRSHRYMLRVSKHKIDNPSILADQLSLSGALTSSCGAEKCIIVAQPFTYILDARSTWIVLLFIYKVPDNLSFSKKNSVK